MTREYWEKELKDVQDKIFWNTKLYTEYENRGYKKASRSTGKELKKLKKRESVITKILTTK